MFFLVFFHSRNVCQLIDVVIQTVNKSQKQHDLNRVHYSDKYDDEDIDDDDDDDNNGNDDDKDTHEDEDDDEDTGQTLHPPVQRRLSLSIIA